MALEIRNKAISIAFWEGSTSLSPQFNAGVCLRVLLDNGL